MIREAVLMSFADHFFFLLKPKIRIRYSSHGDKYLHSLSLPVVAEPFSFLLK